MTRSSIRRAAGALGFAFVAASMGCDRSPAEPAVPTPLIHSLVLFMSSTVASGRTLTPVVGAYKNWSSLWNAPVDFYYPAPADGLPGFESSDVRVVRVNADGTLTAVGMGSAYVKVALYGKRDSLLVSVIPAYSVTLLAATDSVSVVDVNDAGDVAGFIYPGYVTPFDRSKPFDGTTRTGVLVTGGRRIDIGDCFPSAMNNAGQIACNTGFPNGADGNAAGAHPAIYANGAITFPFGSTVDAPTGTVSGVTESGRIYGRFDSANADSILRYKTFVGGPNGIDFLAPSVSRTGKINGLLHGAAVSGPSCGYCQALIIRRDSVRSLAPVSGRFAGARDINDSDDVIGYSEDMSLATGGGTLWRKANQWKAESFSKRVDSLMAISESDQIVGMGDDGAFVWADGRLTNLSDAVADAGWKFSSPVISRSGVIAARGEHPLLGPGVVVIRKR